jgi:hypothetical protein
MTICPGPMCPRMKVLAHSAAAWTLCVPWMMRHWPMCPDHGQHTAVGYHISNLQKLGFSGCPAGNGETQALPTYPDSWTASKLSGLRPLPSRPDVSRHNVRPPQPRRQELIVQRRIIQGTHRPN